MAYYIEFFGDTIYQYPTEAEMLKAVEELKWQSPKILIHSDVEKIESNRGRKLKWNDQLNSRLQKVGDVMWCKYRQGQYSY